MSVPFYATPETLQRRVAALYQQLLGRAPDPSAAGWPAVKDEMRKVLAEIQDGTFTRALIDDDDAGRPRMTAFREQHAKHPIEVTGAQLRPMMAWIDDADE